jgi:cellulose synthase/poly-beta-1,6-N-acetylglucosamine synthase-like glycosyltransferase
MWRFLCPPPGHGTAPLERPPSFSVIIAAYQAAAFIGDALDSALSQTAPPLEVVVCDDGSTDELETALAEYRDRIVLLTQENRGESGAKNAAARASHGDFVVILDSDDVFLPERLEALAALATARPDLDVLTTDAYLELGGQTVRRCYERDFRFETGDQRVGILRRNFVFGLAAVRRQALLAVGGFDAEIRFAADWDLWVRMVLTGSRIGCVDQPLARYRLQAESLSAQRARLIEGRLQTLSKAAARDDLSPEERAVLGRSIEENTRLLLLAQAREAILEGHPDARRLTLELARSAQHGNVTRVKAALSALSPTLARRLLAGAEVETTGGIRYRPTG